MMRVLVTRPEPGAGRTAVRLRTLGLEPVVLPLSETVSLPVAAEALPEDIGGVAVTSANALRHAPVELIARLATLPCHAVGHRTAEAARAAGFRDVVEGPGDAASLAGQIAERFAGRRIAYLAGRVRFPSFEQRLAEAGVEVFGVETYDTRPLVHTDAVVADRLSGRPVDAVLLYSAMAAKAAAGLAARPALKSFFDKAEFLCLSQRIAADLGEEPGRRTDVAARPEEDAMLALLTASG